MANATPADVSVAVPKKKGGKLPMILIAVTAAAAAGGGAYFMAKPAGSSHGAEAGAEHGAASGEHGAAAANEHGASGPKAGAAQYLPLSPAVVVNLDDEVTMRYLSADIELMSRSNDGIEAAKLHMPRIRNTLMLLFTQQKYGDVITRQGKEDLQKAALAAVQAVLKEETGKPGIDGLYFTNFVMQ